MGRSPKVPDIEGLLPSKQALALEMLLAGMSNGEVASKLDVHRHTIGRWLQEPEFAHELRDRQRQNLDAVSSFLNGQVLPSLRFLANTRDNEDAPLSLRARCAQDLADRGLGKPKQVEPSIEPEEVLDDEALTQWVAEKLAEVEPVDG